ncbi:unnamed protein product [Moneuplotes crassus]|uniref:Uncharacterized protein n=1 Tax=Euplotes crassus TaxID=5936 RepID=A0AAD1XVP0_EUPCR|nr:unnamed protein product [Moneuplotes crassus]
MIEDGNVECDYIIKIILIGDSSVGKTCLINKFNDPNDNSNLEVNTTIGYEYCNKYFAQDDRIVQIHLWDTAGQERHRSMIGTYYRKTAGAVLVYDITDRTSFENCSAWIKELQENIPLKPSENLVNKSESRYEENCKLIIVGNKLDLEEQRCVSVEEGERLAEMNDAAFFETSAKTGLNVQGVFETLITKIVECLKQMEKEKTKDDGATLNYNSSIATSIKLHSESSSKKKRACKDCVIF